MNAWVAADPCPPPPPPAPPPTTVANIFMEALTVLAPNSLAALTHTADGVFIMLVVNGTTFLPVGSPAPFSVSGHSITWPAGVYSLNVGDSVAAAYSYST